MCLKLDQNQLEWLQRRKRGKGDEYLDQEGEVYELEGK